MQMVIYIVAEDIYVTLERWGQGAQMYLTSILFLGVFFGGLLS